jgi:hypothetical protein
MVMYINFITTNGCIVSVVTINIVESLLIFILFYAQHTSFTMNIVCLFLRVVNNRFDNIPTISA